MGYTIKINDNIISIKNTGTSNITVSLSLNETCDEDILIPIFQEQILSVGVTKDFKIPAKDGLYRITVTSIFENELITYSHTYPYFGLLLNSIISDMEQFFCGCECEECEECKPEGEELLKLLLKSFGYYTLVYKYYSRFFDAVFKCLNCSILDLSNCILLHEKVTGNFDNEELYKKIISAFYLSFYFIAYYNIEDKDYVNNKFKFKKITRCGKFNTVDMDCIRNTIENNMGVFSIQWDRYINQPPDVVGDYNAGQQANRASLSLTPGMFTNLTTPAYHDPEGDAAQAIRIDTLPTNGALLRYNGTSVTVGQVITIADIGSGMLTITGPDQDTLANSTFNFSVRDTGSMQFSS